jgi:hypothetical protein
MLLLLFACAKKPEPSPATLDELSRLALTNFDNETEADQVASLLTWLHDNPIPESQGWSLEPIAEEDVVGLEHPEDIDLEITGGAGVIDTVDGEVVGYAAATLEVDQSFAEKSYQTWDRTFLSGEAEWMVDGQAGEGPMETDNFIEKSGPFGITIPYSMFKDYRWVEIEGKPVMIARSWVPESGFDNSGNNGILCGFTIEIWEDTEGGVLWYNASWSRLKTIVDDIASEELMIAELIKGTLDYFHGTEAHVNGEDK